MQSGKKRRRNEIDPVDQVPSAEALAGGEEAGKAALKRAVVVKLNGGLGTSMGMRRAKSLLEVKGELTFLDVIARQVAGCAGRVKRQFGQKALARRVTARYLLELFEVSLSCIEAIVKPLEMWLVPAPHLRYLRLPGHIVCLGAG